MRPGNALHLSRLRAHALPRSNAVVPISPRPRQWRDRGAPHRAAEFTALIGITGKPWVEAATKAAEQLGVKVRNVVVGPGQEINDRYFEWAKQRGSAVDGAVLVRPDKHVGSHAHTRSADPPSELTPALGGILNRGN